MINAADWYMPNITDQPSVNITELIIRRRRQILVHSCLYYDLNENVISDHTWQRFADELVRLQALHGYRFGFYDKYFMDWDASTGFFLPGKLDRSILRVAQRLLSHCK
jgi:hypothetical protein